MIVLFNLYAIRPRWFDFWLWNDLLSCVVKVHLRFPEVMMVPHFITHVASLITVFSRLKKSPISFLLFCTSGTFLLFMFIIHFYIFFHWTFWIVSMNLKETKTTSAKLKWELPQLLSVYKNFYCCIFCILEEQQRKMIEMCIGNKSAAYWMMSVSVR